MIIANSTDAPITVKSSLTPEEAKKNFKFAAADTVEDHEKDNSEGRRSAKTLDGRIEETSESDPINKTKTTPGTNNGEKVKYFKEAKICKNIKHCNQNLGTNNALVVIDLEDVESEATNDDVTDAHKNSPEEQRDVVDPENVILSTKCDDQLA